MFRSASKQNLRVILLILMAGCAKIPVSKVSGSSGRLDGDKSPNTPKTDKNEPANDSERAVPPTVVSGTLLVCEVQYDPQPAAEASVVCALKDGKTQTKVDLASFPSHEWRTTVPPLPGVSSITKDMPPGSPWQVQVHVKAENPGQLDQALLGSELALVVQDNLGRRSSVSTALLQKSDAPQWLALNGRRLPANAIAAGTEHRGVDILSICRVRANGGAYPGKMEPHFANPDRAVCYATRDGASLNSMGDDGNLQLFDNDVLVAGNRNWSDFVEWVPLTSGMPLPANAFLGGTDERGENLYLCRALEAGPPADPRDRPNDPLGEWTPGYIKASGVACQYEYYGQKMNPGFQILVWKTAP